MSHTTRDQHVPSSSFLPRRPYRSKRNRPCTLCRARKTSCRRTDDDTSCLSCRKRGQHCSFLDEVSQQPDPISAARASPHTERMLNEMGGSINDALAMDSAGGFMELTLEDSQGQNSSPGYLRHDANQDDFVNRHATEIPTAYEELSDQRIWASDTAEQQQDMPGALDSILYDFSGIGSSPAQPIEQGMVVADERIDSDQAVQFGPLDLNSPENSLQAETGHRVSPNAVVRSPKDQPNEPNSIDQRPDFQSTYFGLSGESDPYLLRHYLYNEADEFPFLRVIYRRTQCGMRSLEQPAQHYDPNMNVKPDIPVQFLLTSNELGEELKRIGPTNHVDDADLVREELNNLVNDEHGRRLILLFVQYVYPALPVISRSQLARGMIGLHVSASLNLSPIPPYLLAAIYASALQFSSYDDVLCVSSVYKKPSSQRLWQIVYDGIQSDLHTPRLATISSALLFLNRPRVGVQNVSADTSFTWSFTTSTIGLVTSLGLHLDCNSWSIPKWEKRLRRRLWWMAYSEATWRSLLLGRPSVIAQDQWSVSGLTSADFELDNITPGDDVPVEVQSFIKKLHNLLTGPGESLCSQHVATLACIADNVYRALYTIKATESLADDLDTSIEIIRPLRQELALWYTKLPMSLKSPKTDPERVTPTAPNSAACLRFAYLTLEILLYRALLRPLGGADLENAPGEQSGEQRMQETWPETQGFCIDTERRFDGKEKYDSFRDQAELIISAAENCATIVTNFTVELMSWDFASFWYSWSRIGWATTSSFLALLLVQSPSVKHAVTCKSLIDRWRQILRHQSQSFQDMSLGILRLDAMYWSNMNKIFRVNSHLEQVIKESQ